MVGLGVDVLVGDGVAVSVSNIGVVVGMEVGTLLPPPQLEETVRNTSARNIDLTNLFMAFFPFDLFVCLNNYTTFHP